MSKKSPGRFIPDEVSHTEILKMRQSESRKLYTPPSEIQVAIAADAR
jgi:hypothetical protein